MKHILLISSFSAISALSFSQQQIANSSFETWETVADGSEPINWNSFLSAQGSLSNFAGDQLDESSDVRPGTPGTKSAHIFSNDIFGTIANGNLTVGKINMGSVTPTNASNYNFSQIANTSFSEALTDAPDSLVFWVKYTPINAATTGKVATILHDSYEFRDGAQVDASSTPHTVATATQAIATTNGQWVRKAIPFSYVGPATTNAFILLTFTTSFTAGGGSDNDQMWIDDVELVYNPAIPVNGQIVANDDTFTTPEGANGFIYVISNDIDPENNIDTNSLQIVNNPAHGTVDVQNGTVYYTPDAGYFGQDAFTYIISDADSPVTTDGATVSITVTEIIGGENNPIITNDDNVTTDQDEAIEIEVLFNDIDPDGQGIVIDSMIITVPAQHGTTSIDYSSGIITYTPDAGYTGFDSFDYRACDNGTPATCSEATVTINVLSPNVGLEENELKNTIVSAVDGKLLIVTSLPYEGSVSVFNTSGQLIYNGKMEPSIPFSEKAGVYFVEVTTDGGSVIRKVFSF